MDGILIIDKPAGITSHDVVARVRRILKTKRVGHTGTLDPFATGVMVVLVGQATRLAQFLDRDAKEYIATVQFGFETDTGDLTGRPKSKGQSPKLVDLERLKSVLPGFLGEIEQVPPMFSAKKIDGKRLYEHARKGVEIERKPVAVTIFELEILSTTPDAGAVEMLVVCSAGTYIRTLAEDIGRRIGVGAHLSSLRRTRAGKFALDDAVTLDELADEGVTQSNMIAMEAAVSHLPPFSISEERVVKTRNGLSTRVFDSVYQAGEQVRMIDTGGTLIAIGAYDDAENVIQPKVVLV